MEPRNTRDETVVKASHVQAFVHTLGSFTEVKCALFCILPTMGIRSGDGVAETECENVMANKGGI